MENNATAANIATNALLATTPTTHICPTPTAKSFSSPKRAWAYAVRHGYWQFRQPPC